MIIMDVREYIKNNILIFDGAMGTMLQQKGLQIGENPEVFGLKNPDKLIRLKEKQMKEAVKVLDFETAAILRDELEVLRNKVADKSDTPI